MTPPHGCGKSQGGGRPCLEGYLPSQLGPCLFLVRACLGCGSSTTTKAGGPAIQRFFSEPYRRHLPTRRRLNAMYFLCAFKLPCRVPGRQASVTHRLHSLTSLREATRSAVRFDVAAEPQHGLRAAGSVDNARGLVSTPCPIASTLVCHYPAA